MNKKFNAFAIFTALSLTMAFGTSVYANAITKVDQDIIDTYSESKKNLLVGDSGTSILEVITHKKAILDASSIDDDDEITINQPVEEEPIIEEIPTTTTSQNKTLYKGIDVSKWQGIINWEKVKQSGIDFAIIRVGYSDAYGNCCKDPYFELNYKKCKELGIPVGCYYYTRATTATLARKEANYVLTQISGKQFEYPICFDIEDDSLPKLCTRQGLTNITIAFCNVLEDNGYYVSIYSNPNWFDNILYKNQLTLYDKWLAHWTTTPKYGSEFGGMWQYGLGTCLGITGDCDMNYSYKDYPSIMKRAGLNGF